MKWWMGEKEREGKVTLQSERLRYFAHLAAGLKEFTGIKLSFTSHHFMDRKAEAQR